MNEEEFEPNSELNKAPQCLFDFRIASLTDSRTQRINVNLFPTRCQDISPEDSSPKADFTPNNYGAVKYL